jgi:hypothetical protein
LVEIIKRYSPRGISFSLEDLESSNASPEIGALKDVISAAAVGFQTEAKIWATELAPWEGILSTIQKNYGERWAGYYLANVASGIRSSAEKCTDTPDLFDSSKSLCRRSRYARLRAGTPTWWEKEFKEAATLDQQMLGCGLYFTWASPNTITETLKNADKIIDALPEDAWIVLFDSVEQAVKLTRPQSRDRVMDLSESENLASISSHRTSALLRLRAKPATARWIYRNLITTYSGSDKRILRIFQLDAISNLLKESEDQSKHLKLLAAAYENDVVSLPYSSYEFARYSNQFNQLGIPLKLALNIVENADRYPSFLVAAAEAKCREETAKHVSPVGKVATIEQWFMHQ